MAPASGSVYVDRHPIGSRWKQAPSAHVVTAAHPQRPSLPMKHSIIFRYTTEQDSAPCATAILTDFQVPLDTRTDITDVFKLGVPNEEGKILTTLSWHRAIVSGNETTMELMREFTGMVFNARSKCCLPVEEYETKGVGKLPFLVAPARDARRGEGEGEGCIIDWETMEAVVKQSRYKGEGTINQSASHLSTFAQGINQLLVAEDYRNIVDPDRTIPASCMLEAMTPASAHRNVSLETEEGDRKVNLLGEFVEAAAFAKRGWSPDCVTGEVSSTLTENQQMADRGSDAGVAQYVLVSTSNVIGSAGWFLPGPVEHPHLQQFLMSGTRGYLVPKKNVAEMCEGTHGVVSREKGTSEPRVLLAVATAFGMDISPLPSSQSPSASSSGQPVRIKFPISVKYQETLTTQCLRRFEDALGYRFQDLNTLRYALECWIGRDKGVAAKSMKRCGIRYLTSLIADWIRKTTENSLDQHGLHVALSEVYDLQAVCRAAFPDSALGKLVGLLPWKTAGVNGQGNDHLCVYLTFAAMSLDAYCAGVNFNDVLVPIFHKFFDATLAARPTSPRMFNRPTNGKVGKDKQPKSSSKSGKTGKKGKSAKKARKASS